jgi:hypothetical protein
MRLPTKATFTVRELQAVISDFDCPSSGGRMKTIADRESQAA